MISSGRVHHRMTSWALIVSMCLAVILAAAQPVSGQAPDSLTLERQVEPSQGVLGQVEFSVTLTLTGSSSQCTGQVVHRPADIILVIDHSDSMYDSAGGGSSGTKMDLLKEAAKIFLTKVDMKTDLVGVVEFDLSSDVAHALSNDLASLQNAIEAIQEGDGTAIDQGVVMAQREFSSGRARQDTSHIIILLTDGQQSTPFGLGGDPISAAQEARNDGIRVITIGLGEDADQNTLRQMASQVSDFYYAPQASDLERIYSSIAETVVQPIGATDVVVEHTYDATVLEVVPDSVNPPGVIQGDKISWAVKEVLDAPLTLSYRVKPRAAGTITVDRGDIVRYNRCGTEPQEMTLPPGLPVAVDAPTPTPTPTPLPTPTFTPTPRPTSAPAPTPLPTATPTLSQKAGQIATSLFCDTSRWPWCLGVLLLLFFLWWLWRLIKELGKPVHERRICRWIPWLFLPLALIWLALALSNLGGAVCTGRESVYFWRIESGQRNGEIWVTDKDGARPAREFAAVGQGHSCVGCHAVSSTSHRIAAVADSGVGPILVYDLRGRRVDTPNVTGSFAAWSPDGNKLAVSTDDRDIVIMDVENQTVNPLSGASDPSILEEMPAWSSDGQAIAFVRGTSSGNPWTFESPCDIYVVSASGGVATPLEGASGDGFNYYPAYSPDGRWLAFTHHVSGTTTYSALEAEVFIIPAGGGQRVRLAANDGEGGAPLQNVSNSWPTWSLDGQWLAFNSKRNDNAYDLFITRVDENGNSGPAVPLKSAGNPGIFEHLPYWGEPPKVDPWAGILGLWPCLLPVLLVFLAWWLCRRLTKRRIVEVPPLKAVRVPPGKLPPVSLTPLWQVAPTLIVGVGGTGRWVLTHLKKALRDGGSGVLPANVRFVLLDTSEQEETNVFRDATGKITGVEFAGVSLTPDEILLLGQNMSTVIDQGHRAADAALDGWFPFDDYRGLTAQERNLAAGTSGRRPLARAGLIDKLREGVQQQPPAGAGNNQVATPESSHQEQVGNDAALLWGKLVADCGKVLDDKLVRVIIVGSLTGGMGGTLFDLAYLARRAGMRVIPSNGTVHLEGYFTTPGAFHDVPANQTRLQVNAMAAGRELQRFQLSQGFPFPMDYLTVARPLSEGDPAYMAQACDWRLFDDVTLFGGGGSPERGEDKSGEPWATVLASMADVITFRMDRAVNSGSKGDYRAGMRADVNAKQQHTGMAVGSSAGSYAYRLPLVDILEIVHTRWARKLVHVFLNGNVTSNDVSFEPAEAGMEDTPEQYALKFVMGEHEAGDVPQGMRTVGYLATGGDVMARDVLELAGDDGEPFEQYLARAMGLILNGDQGAGANLERRAPRLGYGVAFAQAVRKYMEDAHREAQMRQAGAPTDSGRPWWKEVWIKLGGGKATQEEWQAVTDKIRTWLGKVDAASKSLKGVRGLLVGTEEQQDQSPIRGLYSELKIRQTKAEDRRKQMDQVAVRRYLWSRPANPDMNPADPQNQQDLADEWYNQAEKRLGEFLGRFYWYIGRDGGVRLGLITFGETQKSVALDYKDARSVQELADELLHLAVYVTQDWARIIQLRDVLRTQFSSREEDPAIRMIERVWPVAIPHLNPARDVNAGLDGTHMAAAGLPPNVQEDPSLGSLAKALAELGTPAGRLNNYLEPCKTSIIATTDRTAMTLAREHNLMPIQNLPEFQDALKAYIHNAGTETDKLVESAPLATVFAAEHRALEFERRLESNKVVNQDFRILHPLVVLALARGDLAELYALAFAAGWVKVQSGVARLTIPGQDEVELSLPDQATATGGLDPRVAGLLRVASGREEDVPWIKRLRETVFNPAKAPKKEWGEFIDSYWPRVAQLKKRECVNGHEMREGAKFCRLCGGPPKSEILERAFEKAWQPPFNTESQPIQDLAAIAALAAYRQIAPDDWDGLVMSRSRRIAL